MATGFVLSASRAGITSASYAPSPGAFNLAGIGTVVDPGHPPPPPVSLQARLWSASYGAIGHPNLSNSLAAALQATSSARAATSISISLHSALQASSTAAIARANISIGFHALLTATSDANASAAVVSPGGTSVLSASRSGIVSAVWAKTTLAGTYHVTGIGTVLVPGPPPNVANLTAQLNAASWARTSATIPVPPISLIGRITAASRGSGYSLHPTSLAGRITTHARAQILYIPPPAVAMRGQITAQARAGAAATITNIGAAQQDAVSVIS